MAEQFSFYCDESGNSGSNYVDADQSFYLVAVFLYPDSCLADAAVTLEELRARYSPQSKELKSTRILRRPAGLACMEQMVSDLGSHGAIPLFVLAEKRYCVAAKIVDTYLDPPFNDVLSDSFTVDRETKVELANDLLSYLGPDTLNAFASAYRSADADALASSLELIIDETRGSLSAELSTVLEGARPHIRDISAAESWQSGGGFDGINLPALLSLFQMIEAMGRKAGISISKFVHDETASHEEAYRRTFVVFKGLGDTILSLPEGSLPASGLSAIAQFETQSSEDSPLIQAADLLAGALARACNTIASGNSMTEREQRFHSTVFAPLITDLPFALAWPIASDRFLSQLGSAIGWTANSGAGGPVEGAPDTSKMFPLTRGQAPRVQNRTAFPCPAWALRETDGRLLVVRRSASPDAKDGDPPVLPLFSSEPAATRFAADHYPDEQLSPLPMGDSPSGMWSMIEAIKAAALTAHHIAIDIHEEGPWKVVPIQQCVADLEGLASRAMRAVATGVVNVLQQEHEVDGCKFITLLLSSGKYGAQDLSGGHVHTGATREAALARAVAATRRQESP